MMNSQERQSEQEILTTLDDTFSHQRVDREYPYIYINPKNTEPLPVVMSLLAVGDLPVLFTLKESTYEIGRIDKSPLNLQKLLRVYAFELHINETTQMVISSTSELMEAMKWMQ